VWPEDAEFGGTVTVWTAFTDASIETGCLQFIPSSHKTMNYDESKAMEYHADSINRMEKAGVRRGFFGYDYRQLQKDPSWSPDETKAISQVMRQGQFVIFWSTLMHASHPHSGLTNNMRMGRPLSANSGSGIPVFHTSRRVRRLGEPGQIRQRSRLRSERIRPQPVCHQHSQRLPVPGALGGVIIMDNATAQQRSEQWVLKVCEELGLRLESETTTSLRSAAPR
jgi:hypothetical protein